VDAILGDLRMFLVFQGIAARWNRGGSLEPGFHAALGRVESMSVGMRIEEVRAQLDLRQVQMAGRMGMPLRTYTRYASGERSPSAEALQALAHMGVDLNWLMTGEGRMWTGGGDAPRTIDAAAPAAASPGPDFVLVPRYDVRASAGGGAMVHSEQIVDYLAFKADWVHSRLGVPPANLLLLEASGDSMEPTISDGDLLLVSTHEPRIRDNAIYAININGDLLVKRIQRRMDGTLLVMSDNSRYSPETLSAQQAETLRVIGQVFWHGGLI